MSAWHRLCLVIRRWHKAGSGGAPHDVAFVAYLVLVLAAFVYVVEEPEQAADLVRSVTDWVRDMAEVIARSLPKPVPVP